MDNLFNLECSKYGILHRIICRLGDVLPTIMFTITRNQGLTISEPIINNHAMTILINIKPHFFWNYECHVDKISIGVNSELLCKKLAFSDTNNSIHLYVERDNPNILYIKHYHKTGVYLCDALDITHYVPYYPGMMVWGQHHVEIYAGNIRDLLYDHKFYLQIDKKKNTMVDSQGYLVYDRNYNLQIRRNVCPDDIATSPMCCLGLLEHVFSIAMFYATTITIDDKQTILEQHNNDLDVFISILDKPKIPSLFDICRTTLRASNIDYKTILGDIMII